MVYNKQFREMQTADYHLFMKSSFLDFMEGTLSNYLLISHFHFTGLCSFLSP